MIASELSEITSYSGLSTVVLILGLLYLASHIISNIYWAFFGPLAKFPGPKSRALSYVPFAKTEWSGTNASDAIELHERYGDVVRTGPRSLSFIGTPETWKGIYGFRKAGIAENAKDPRFYGQPVNKVAGLITADGPTHSRQRKVVSNAFSDKALKELEPMFKLWTAKMKDFLSQKADKGVATDMVRAYNFTTFDIMADLTFGEPLHMLDTDDYVPWVTGIFSGIKTATHIRALRVLSQATRRLLDELLHRIPAIRQKGLEHWTYTSDKVDRRLSKTPGRTDLWSIVLEKGGMPDQQGSLLSRKEHQSIASLFMIAGTETTATALSGITFYLLKNPKYMTELKEELSDAFETFEDMHLDALARLPLLEAVIKEGLRIYPPVPIGFPRVAPQGGAMIGEMFVPEGTSMYVHQQATYRCEKNFRNAHEFHPERWLGDSEYENDNLMAWEPFSTGPRNCVGKNLAWHEMRILLATTILHFDLELCAESENWNQQQVFTLWQKSALMCKLRERAST